MRAVIGLFLMIGMLVPATFGFGGKKGGGSHSSGAKGSRAGKTKSKSHLY